MPQSLVNQNQSQSKYEELVRLLSDRKWRLENLYYIQDKEGRKVKFKPNSAQRKFYGSIWYINCILKARQLGLSTFILIYILDAILFNPNKAAGIIAQGLSEAGDLFKNKVKFAYDNLPDQIKQMVPAVQDSASSLTFKNGSSIKVGTSLRGGTFQYLHVSEYGKIAAKYPEKAREIKTGALNTVSVGQQIFIESTAEGQEGEFYELCKHAQELQQLGAELTPMDPRFHFFPWYEDVSYTLDYNVPFGQDLIDYFIKVEQENGVTLTEGQKAWYAKKKLSMGDDMLREFPSTPEESFQTSVEGTYFNKEMAYLRKEGRITSVPWKPKIPVHTFWDIGISDDMCVVFMQKDGEDFKVIDYYENSGEGLQHYADHLKAKPYVYGDHYWPHDGVKRDQITANELWKTAQSMGIKPIRIVERTQNLAGDIQTTRNFLPQCYFDAIKCDKLIKHLSSYRKEWNDRLGVWRDSPRHDEASHGADAFRCLAVGFKERIKVEKQRHEPDDWSR